MTMQYIWHYKSPLGPITLASDKEALTGLWFDGQKYFGTEGMADAVEKETFPVKQAEKWLDIYFAAEKPDFTPVLHLNGTVFQREVWEILKKIPYGKTMTYKEIADLIAVHRKTGSMSSQAVGGAVGHNPISIIIPCHRVLGSDGSLKGYAGGIHRKACLLALEKSVMLL